MTADQQEAKEKRTLAGNGFRLEVSSPDDLQHWGTQEQAKWQWLTTYPLLSNTSAHSSRLYKRVKQAADQWRASGKDVEQILKDLRDFLEQSYSTPFVLNSESPEGKWVLGLQKERGDAIAAGAYAALTGHDLGNPIQQPKFVEGLIEGFLFRREIDWTASTHRDTLVQLESEYKENLALQEASIADWNNKIQHLVVNVEENLTQLSENLKNLHSEQANEFTELRDQHIQRLTTIEQTYDQKLALQKPVEYWQQKETHHKSRARIIGFVSTLVGLALTAVLGLLAYWIFAHLGKDEDPKHWQLGVLVITAFFAIWFERVLVRLFFSHLHLAGDAAERGVMILTYLSIAREGGQFGTDDKRLILQHLFRTASDGLVKDDAAPPSLFEMLTRR